MARKMLLLTSLKRGLMRRAYLAGILGVVVLLLSNTSYGATFVGSLSGSAENPPTGSAGTGSAIVTYDPTTHMLTVNFDFSGLLGLTTAAHIHCCVAPPGNAGVATQVPTFPSFPLGVTSGTYANTFDLTQASSFNPAYITANGGTPAGAEAALVNGLSNNMAYLNIHTTMFPGGEIRSFLVPLVPPTLSKVFGASTISLNGTTSLTFTLTNPAANTVALTGVAFTDNLPAGLVVATPNGLTNSCGGTATAVAGSGSVSLTGGTIATNSNCTVKVDVTGTALGTLANTTGAVSSTNGGTGNMATATVNVFEIQSTPVPTLTEWGMIMLTVLLGIGSVLYLRRRRLVI